MCDDLDTGFDVTDVGSDVGSDSMSLGEDMTEMDVTDAEIESFEESAVETLSLEDDVTGEEIETLSLEDDVTDEEIETLSLEDDVTGEEIETLSLEDDVTTEELETPSLDDEVTDEEIAALLPDDEFTDVAAEEEVADVTTDDKPFDFDDSIPNEPEEIYAVTEEGEAGVELPYTDDALPEETDGGYDEMDSAEPQYVDDAMEDDADVTYVDDAETDAETDVTDGDMPEEEFAIPGSLDEAYDQVENDGADLVMPEREYDAFEQAQMEKDPEFYETGQFYDQGINEYGYDGTCGPTSQASAVNKVLGINELTENKVLGIAIDNNLCTMDGTPEENGGTTTEQFMELYDKVNESIGDKINTELYEFDNALSMDEMAQRIDEGAVLNVAVDSATLWGENDHIPGTLAEDVCTDHWITVTDVTRDELGNVSGFDVIDSGGGVDHVDAATYERMCFGEDGREMLDPTCIVVSKKDS